MPSFMSKHRKKNKRAKDRGGAAPSTSAPASAPAPATPARSPATLQQPSSSIADASPSTRESPLKKLLRRSTSSIGSSWKGLTRRRESEASTHSFDSPGLQEVAPLTPKRSRVSDLFTPLSDRHRQEPQLQGVERSGSLGGLVTPLRPRSQHQDATRSAADPVSPTVDLNKSSSVTQQGHHHRASSSLSSMTGFSSPSPTAKQFAARSSGVAEVRPSQVASVDLIATSREMRSDAVEHGPGSTGDVLGLTNTGVDAQERTRDVQTSGLPDTHVRLEQTATQPYTQLTSPRTPPIAHPYVLPSLGPPIAPFDTGTDAEEDTEPEPSRSYIVPRETTQQDPSRSEDAAERFGISTGTIGGGEERDVVQQEPSVESSSVEPTSEKSLPEEPMVEDARPGSVVQDEHAVTATDSAAQGSTQEPFDDLSKEQDMKSGQCATTSPAVVDPDLSPPAEQSPVSETSAVDTGMASPGALDHHKDDVEAHEPVLEERAAVPPAGESQLRKIDDESSPPPVQLASDVVVDEQSGPPREVDMQGDAIAEGRSGPSKNVEMQNEALDSVDAEPGVAESGLDISNPTVNTPAENDVGPASETTAGQEATLERPIQTDSPQTTDTSPGERPPALLTRSSSFQKRYNPLRPAVPSVTPSLASVSTGPDDAHLHEARTSGGTAFTNQGGMWIGTQPVSLDSVAIKTLDTTQRKPGSDGVGSEVGFPTDNLGEDRASNRALAKPTSLPATQPPMLPFIPRLFAPRLTLEFKWADRLLPSDVMLDTTISPGTPVTAQRERRISLYKSVKNLSGYGANFVPRNRITSGAYGQAEKK